jgi:hypothetical protein
MGRRRRLVDAQLTFNIRRLEKSKAYHTRLTSLPINRGQRIDGLVTRTFRYKSGRVCEVRAHAKAMVGLLKAMRSEHGIEVTATVDSPYSGSTRTWEQQEWLSEEYKAGRGHKAAEQGHGYHQTGRSIYLLLATEQEKMAMLDVRVDGKEFFNGAIFGDPPHYSFGELG